VSLTKTTLGGISCVRNNLKVWIF